MKRELGKHFLNLALGIALTGIIQPLIQGEVHFQVLFFCLALYLLLGLLGSYLLKKEEEND